MAGFDFTNHEGSTILNVHYAVNPLSQDGQRDKYFFVKDRSVTVSQDAILQRMYDSMPGVSKEAMRLSVYAFQNEIAEALRRGENVTTFLFHATSSPKGSSADGTWDPERNTIVVTFRQSATMREAIKKADVLVNGERTAEYYISSVMDNETGINDNTGTAGSNITILGKNVKIEGDQPTVGIWLKKEGASEEICVRRSLITVNTCKKVVVTLPAKLTEGQYTLIIRTTPKVGKDLFSKSVREMSMPIYISGALED